MTRVKSYEKKNSRGSFTWKMAAILFLWQHRWFKCIEKLHTHRIQMKKRAKVFLIFLNNILILFVIMFCVEKRPKNRHFGGGNIHNV